MSAPESGFATALFGAGSSVAASETERNQLLTRVSEDLRVVETVFAANPHVFFHPGVPSARQIELLGAFAGQISAITLQFLILLSVRRRLKLVARIRQRFDILCEKSFGAVSVKLSLPFEPSAAMIERFRDALAERGLYAQERKAEAAFAVTVDKSLIGGFVAEADGLVLDTSLKTKLLHLRPGA